MKRQIGTSPNPTERKTHTITISKEMIALLEADTNGMQGREHLKLPGKISKSRHHCGGVWQGNTLGEQVPGRRSCDSKTTESTDDQGSIQHGDMHSRFLLKEEQKKEMLTK